MRTDTLARRLRFDPPNPARRPKRAPKTLILTDADYLVLAALNRNGPLPIHYLFEFQRHLRPSYRHFQYRLRDLFHGDDGGSYLSRPPAQFASYTAHYQHLVYDVSPRARAALADRELLSPCTPRRYDPFVHQLMVACVTASFELTATAHGVRYIGTDEILARRHTSPGPIRLSVAIGLRRLTPDGLFGLEYPGRGFRFFALEADRNTETVSSRRARTTTFGKKLEDYAALLAGRLYKAHWGVPNLTVLTITTSDRHRANLLHHLKGLQGIEHKGRFLFQSEASFRENWRVPGTLLTSLLGEPWEGVEGMKRIDAA